jgi:hypothetical protein
MPLLRDDRDIIRAFGFVAIYSSDLEDEVAELLRAVTAFAPLVRNVESLHTSDQARHLRKHLKDLFSRSNSWPYKPEEERRVEATLRAVERVAKERNEILHSPLQADLRTGNITQHNRRRNTRRPISSAEVYALAQRIFDVRSGVLGLQFPIERLRLTMRCDRARAGDPKCDGSRT